MNPRLHALHAYPFERLARLKSGSVPPAGIRHIAMSIGEPQHAPPEFLIASLRENASRVGNYPATGGMPELRAAGASWLERRYGLPSQALDPASMVLPACGTREALFAFIQAAVDARPAPLVAIPNPFYQIYEGAALLAGAEPYLLDTTAATGYLPDLEAVPARVWQRCQILVLCSPGNPTGKVLPAALLERALELAERHAFLVALDECYSDIYLDEAAPPPGLLQVAWANGRARFQRCVVFHSLSKRSSVPGLRSGLIAGDPQVLEALLRYRTYHGAAMPVPTQLASIAAWGDAAHVRDNRLLYQEKFVQVLPILRDVIEVERPDGAFYLWLDTGADDERFTRELYARENVTVLPGSYLARPGATGRNPGAGRVRISLTAPLVECIEAAGRIRNFVATCKESA